MSPSPLRVLLVEDSENDAVLILEALRHGGYEPDWERVQTAAALKAALKSREWEIVFCDYSMPGFDAIRALQLLNETGLELPFIIISGAIGEETAVAAMKQGAVDYLLKDRLMRLGAAVGHALEQSRLRRERARAETARQESEARLSAFIDNNPAPIFFKDTAGRYVHVNRGFEQKLRLKPEQVIGRTDAEIFAPEQAAAFQANDRQVLKAGRALEFEEQARYGDEVHTSIVSKFPLRDAEGRIGGLGGITTDITERKRREAALRAAERQLHTLVGRLHSAREEEGKRIARELHDDLGQQLTALNMELDELERKLGEVTSGQRERFARMHAGVNRTIEAVQKISGELRLGQLDLLGLTAAIEWQLKDFSRRSAIPCRIVRLDEIENISDGQGTAVFRILQEALTNIVRHAGATEVEVSVERGPDELALKVRDNGRGITAVELNDQKAIGLLGMRERAQLVGGRVTITGGAGTTVLVQIPLKRTKVISP